jgi:hypothetical protein
MWISEQTIMQIARERMGEAERAAARARAVRLARASRPGVRVRLGACLVRLGWWIMKRGEVPGGRSVDIGRVPL